MKRMRWTLFTIILGIAAASPASGRTVIEDSRNLSLDFETRAASLVEQMTLEEKISQLGNHSAAIDRLGIEAYDWWNECLHGVARAGVATVFPQAIGMAASFDRQLMYETACVISDEARAKHHEALRNDQHGRYQGLTFWSPNINIFRDPRWGRGHETYGEDPYLTGQMGIQFVKGLQGDDRRYLKLVATAKHYAVHNGPEPERHSFNVVISQRDLWETYLPAFEDLVVEGKVYSVMGAYNRVDGASATASWMLTEDILRKQWGFGGYVVSDCGSVFDIYANHKIVNTKTEAAAVGLRQGCDLNCGGMYQRYMKEAVESGMIDECEIDRAVYRLMLARMKLGMFDPPEKVPYAQIPYSVNNCKAHDAVALAMAQKSMTLLKNNGLLPLDKTRIKTIAVVGPNADSVAALRGNYYGTASNPVTVLEGIRRAVGPEVQVLYSPGCPLVKDDPLAIDGRCLFTTDDSGQTVSGLRGEYFRGQDLAGEPVLVRIDPTVAMDWGRSSPTATEVSQGILSPEQGLGEDHFSVRWTGRLVPPASGAYQIGLMSDDGCRLYIDGKRVVDGWSNHGMEPFVTELTLEKDRSYDVKIEYYDNVKEAAVHFIWQQPSMAAQGQPGGFQVPVQTIEDVKKADIAVFVGGLDASWEGEEMRGRTGIEGFEKGDRTAIELPKIQRDTLNALQQTGTPVVFVLLAGSAIAFDGLDADLPAMLMGWYPGQRGGDAVADVLFGVVNPAGRLPVTFYTSTDELGDFKDYYMRGGKGKTYRYYTGRAAYPFGHGLSYTAFTYSDLKVSRTKMKGTDQFTVSVKVENTGDRDGEEVVQLYVRDVTSKLPMPIKQLRNFERVALQKGEQKKVTFKLDAARDLRYFDAFRRQYAVEPGDFELQVGSSSEDIRLKKTITVR